MLVSFLFLEKFKGTYQSLFFSYFIQITIFHPQFTLRQLIQPDLESRFIVRSQLGPSVQSGASPGAGLQVVTRSTHLSKDSYPQLVSNPYRSEIRPLKQLDYRCMPLRPALAGNQLFKVYNEKARTNCEVFSKIRVKKSLPSFWYLYCLL